MEAAPTHAVRLERLIHASREALFRAWTEAGTLVKWFAPGDEMGCTVLEADPRAGGRLWIDMTMADGSRHELRCTYVEVLQPERIVLRWTWATNPAAGESRVTVTFTEAAGGTQLVLLHEGLPQPSRASHEMGWTGCLGRLASKAPQF